MDLRQLMAMQSFLTDRITNITVTAANQINAQLGSVAIGALLAPLGEEARR
jgi:hypothetical protein